MYMFTLTNKVRKVNLVDNLWSIVNECHQLYLDRNKN